MDNKQNDMYEEKNMSPIAAGLTGFILGVVGTAAVALSDKNTRTKVTKKANAMKDNLEKWSKDTLHELQATGEDVKKRAAEKNDELKTQSQTPGETITEKTEDVLSEENRKEL
jgi:hypothetical protein